MGNPALAHSGQELVELKLKPGILTIGSAADNDIVLTGPEISSYHCKIVTYFHMALLVDLSSVTGTYLNDRRVVKHSLKKGDHLRLGEQEMTISDINNF